METVTLNKKEQKRLLVFNEVIAGRMTGQSAADVLGLSLRHTRRLLADYRRRGVVALAHGNRGREPANKLDVAVAADIVRLARGEYHDYNDCHFAEELAEHHEISLSRATVRRVRRAHGQSTQAPGAQAPAAAAALPATRHAAAGRRQQARLTGRARAVADAARSHRRRY